MAEPSPSQLLPASIFFGGWTGLARVALISACAYVMLVLVLRVSGKRSLAKLNAFDLVVTVAFGSTLATILLSKDVALAEGALAFAMLALLQWVVSSGSVRWPWLKRLVRAEPTLLMRNGDFQERALQRARLTRAEVEQAIRNAGIGRFEQVGAVVLETDGSLSVIRRDDDEAELSTLRSVSSTTPDTCEKR